MQQQAGARWIAHQRQQDSGAGEPDVVVSDVKRADDLPRYSIWDCMGERARAEWAQVAEAYGVTGPSGRGRGRVSILHTFSSDR